MKIKSIKQKTITLQEIWDSGTEEQIHSSGDGSIRLVSGLVVDTVNGPRRIDFAYRTLEETVRVEFKSGNHVECTPSHRLKTSSGWCTAKDLEYDSVVLTKEGTDVVSGVIWTNEVKPVYDISVPGPRNYYANGIVSHNSAIIGQLAKNQAMAGYKVNVVPLEMSHIEMLARYLANVTGIDNTKILLKRLATAEKEESFRRWRRFERRMERNGGRLTIFKPQEDLTIEGVMAAIHSYNADITYIDYISLLKGADGEDQWRQLGAIGRYAKIYAESHKKVMALAAQVNEEGKLRYSKAVGEHSSTAFSFVATKESREKGYINVDMFKARNQQMMNFTLGVDYASMRIYDLSPEELESKVEVRKGRRDSEEEEGGKGSKRSKNKEYLPDLTE